MMKPINFNLIFYYLITWKYLCIIDSEKLLIIRILFMDIYNVEGPFKLIFQIF